MKLRKGAILCNEIIGVSSSALSETVSSHQRSTSLCRLSVFDLHISAFWNVWNQTAFWPSVIFDLIQYSYSLLWEDAHCFPNSSVSSARSGLVPGVCVRMDMFYILILTMLLAWPSVSKETCCGHQARPVPPAYVQTHKDAPCFLPAWPGNWRRAEKGAP